jgi:hypothetical protein
VMDSMILSAVDVMSYSKTVSLMWSMAYPFIIDVFRTAGS